MLYGMSYHSNTSTTSQTNSSNGAPQSASYADTGTQPGSGANLLREGSTYYDTARSDIEQLGRIDVTEQIREINKIYGSSANTQQNQTASSKGLNYAIAPTMQRAKPLNLTAFPYTFNFIGEIGLFGAENVYARIDMNLLTLLNDQEVDEDGWQPAYIDFGYDITVNTYEPAVIDVDLDPPPAEPDPYDQIPPEQEASTQTCVFIGGIPDEPILQCYYHARITLRPPDFDDPLVSVELFNRGTGNIYIDTWLEPMLYTRDGEMWPYDIMYLSPKDFFYVGFHARNTRRLAYNIDVKIGSTYIPSERLDDQRLKPYAEIAPRLGPPPLVLAEARQYVPPGVEIKGPNALVRHPVGESKETGDVSYTSMVPFRVKGATTYQWSARLGNQNATSRECEFKTPNDQNTLINFKSRGEFIVECLWTNPNFSGGQVLGSIRVDVT